MRRLLEPAVFVFGVALFASLLFHLSAFVSLDRLAKLFEAERETPEETVEVELEFEESEPTEPDEQADDAEPRDPDAVVEGAPRPEVAERREEAERERAHEEAHEEEREPEPEAEREVAVVPRRPPPEAMNKQAIQQRSQNPNVETPPDARYVAQENNVVEEETVARLRNFARDDVEQEAGAHSEAEVQETGNAEDEAVADAREMEGSDARTPTEAESNAVRPREADDTPPPNVQARGDTARQGAADDEIGPSRADARAGSEGGARASGGGVRERLVEVNDGQGTFVIALPEPVGEGEGADGGRLVTGEGQGARGAGARAGREGRGRVGERGMGRGMGVEGRDLRVSWSAFEETYGEEQLREERETWLRERQSRLEGSNRERDWREFRAAIENFVPNVRPGNQTALNAAASPFAEYIAAVHRRIHREFAYRFLAGLPAGAMSPFSDPTLETKLEIILNRDGSVHRVGVVKPSGFLPFDHGAFTAVMRAQPYPAAPSSILSGDGKVYIHWGFFRNARQCGTFNAEPYILPHPPGTPRPGQHGLRDLENGGVVPEGAEPTWGTTGEAGGAPPHEHDGEGEHEHEDGDGAPREEDEPLD